MGVQHRDPVFTCDRCGAETDDSDNVVAVVVSFDNDPRNYSGSGFSEIWHGHLCKTCLGNARVPNPSPKYDDAAYVDYSNRESLAKRLIAWLFAPLELEEPR